jgi:hypothetical protein
MERFRLPSRGHERHARDRVRGIGGPDSGDERPDPWMFWRRVHDFNMTVSDATSGLTFSGVNPFDVLLPPGATTTFNLGTFNRERTNVSSNLDPLAFTLQLMLTLPAVIGTGPSTLFTSSIHGTTPGGAALSSLTSTTRGSTSRRPPASSRLQSSRTLSSRRTTSRRSLARSETSPCRTLVRRRFLSRQRCCSWVWA